MLTHQRLLSNLKELNQQQIAIQQTQNLGLVVFFLLTESLFLQQAFKSYGLEDACPYSQETSKASGFFAKRKMEKCWSYSNANISSSLQVSVDTPNTFCLFSLLLISPLQRALSVGRAKPLGLDFTPLRVTESKICSVVEQHNAAIHNLCHRDLSSGIP